MSEKYDVVSSYWHDNQWSIKQLKYAVKKGWITSQEFEDITNEPYTAPLDYDYSNKTILRLDPEFEAVGETEQIQSDNGVYIISNNYLYNPNPYHYNQTENDWKESITDIISGSDDKYVFVAPQLILIEDPLTGENQFERAYSPSSEEKTFTLSFEFSLTQPFLYGHYRDVNLIYFIIVPLYITWIDESSFTLTWEDYRITTIPIQQASAWGSQIDYLAMIEGIDFPTLATNPKVVSYNANEQ